MRTADDQYRTDIRLSNLYEMGDVSLVSGAHLDDTKFGTRGCTQERQRYANFIVQRAFWRDGFARGNQDMG